MNEVVDNQAAQAKLDETKVPAFSERVVNIFELPTEVIKRGRRHKPLEFGRRPLC